MGGEAPHVLNRIGTRLKENQKVREASMRWKIMEIEPQFLQLGKIHDPGVPNEPKHFHIIHEIEKEFPAET